MKTAKDIMTKDVVSASVDMTVKEFADLLVKKNIGGAPVLDRDGRVVGVASESDLVVKDARIHYPTYLHLLDGFIYWPGSVSKFNTEFKKALGLTVGDIMNHDPVTALETATIEDIATLIADHEIGRIPIVDETGRLTGLVTTHDIITAIGKSD
jgi:CBS domain-containing protein